MSALDALCALFGELTARQWYARGADPGAWVEADAWLAREWRGSVPYRVVADGRTVEEGTTRHPVATLRAMDVDDVNSEDDLKVGDGTRYVEIHGACPLVPGFVGWWTVTFEY